MFRFGETITFTFKQNYIELPVLVKRRARRAAADRTWGVYEPLRASLHVLAGGPTAATPHWHLRAVVDDVTPGVAVPFPSDFIWDQPEGVDVFVFDPPNELSTLTQGSSGAITFQQLQCGSGGVVEFSIDAVIGSEFGNGPPITMTGSFRAAVGQPPTF
jgi:hypothetical protein